MSDTPLPAEPHEDPAAPDDATPAPRRRWRRRRATAGVAEAAIPEATVPPPAPDAPADPTAAPAEPVPGVGGPRRLRRDRRRLIARREEVVYHLGGLAFELYRRDQLSEDVMRRRGDEIAEIDDTVRDIDARLGEIDRDRRDRRRREPLDPSIGCCLVCRTPFRAEARFCWQCGTQVIPPSMGDEQVTAVISAGPLP